MQQFLLQRVSVAVQRYSSQGVHGLGGRLSGGLGGSMDWGGAYLLLCIS